VASPLADLDELVLKCRDEKALSYIREAVSCYKVGSFRSSIVSTWIAVVFDILDKIKELSLSGDKEAEKQLGEFESARETGDITRSLKFERDILEVARDKLELISHIEFMDLERLQQDRNRCAHPSMTADGEIFNPSAELSRVHIRNSIEYLLQFPPSQGKNALGKLISDVNSEYFPTNTDNALIALQNSPLFKARKSLVRNFIIVLLKGILKETLDYKERLRITSALKAVERLYKEIYDSTLQEKVSPLIRQLDDNELDKLTPILNYFPSYSGYFDEDVSHKVSAYIQNLPSSMITDLETLLEHPEFGASAEIRVNKISINDFQDAFFFSLPEKIADKMISLFLDSRTFDQANTSAKIIALHADDYTERQVYKIVTEAAGNNQITGSFGIDTVFAALRKSKIIPIEDFDKLLVELGIDNYEFDSDTEG